MRRSGADEREWLLWAPEAMSFCRFLTNAPDAGLGGFRRALGAGHGRVRCSNFALSAEQYLGAQGLLRLLGKGRGRRGAISPVSRVALQGGSKGGGWLGGGLAS